MKRFEKPKTNAVVTEPKETYDIGRPGSSYREGVYEITPKSEPSPLFWNLDDTILKDMEKRKREASKKGGPPPSDPMAELNQPRPLFDQGFNWEFKHYRSSLLNKDPKTIEATTELPPLHFFTGEDEDDGPEHDVIVLASYPRSGNTMLRGYLERIMGLCTGSDNDITKKLVTALHDLGLVGEGLVDKRTWIVKTHYPERWGKARYRA